jgi:cell division protein FtsZ
LGDALTVTVVATGFKSSSIPEFRTGMQDEKVRVSIGDDFQESNHFSAKTETFFPGESSNVHEWIEDPQEEVISRLYPKRMIDPFSGAPEVVRKVMHVDFYNQSEEYINELSKIPAYERRRMKQQKSGGVSDNGKSLSRFSISNTPEEGFKIRKNNAFIHDKPD